LPVWLAAKGLDEASIGSVLAVAVATRVAVMPFGARAADRFGSLKGAIVVAASLCALCLSLLGLASGAPAIFLCYAAAAAAGGTVLPLIEAYALRGLHERGLPYGPVRLWGSAAFILGTLATGLLAAWIAPVNIIWILVATYWLAAVSALRLQPVASAAAPDLRPARVGLLLKNRTLLMVIGASACMQGSHGMLYIVGTLQWSAAGLSGLWIAWLWTFGVVAEILLFAASARFPAWLGAAALLAIGAAGAILRWGIMALDPPTALLPFLQCLHALSFGATHLGAVGFVARAAPPGLHATAQGLLATANGGMMAASMAISGLLQTRYGVSAYAAMALMAATGGALALLVRTRN
jgi:PPP family 3-phenylpropionic acid transporter